ncbi:Imm1 family immunity protein [Kitasatospora sp. NPDC059673]|uniref:Imm1 family immunity protein n=1 Tax=Kitasatospora sp. NPDC059673 TaxID=3346901 RepID=UPI0036CDD354
MILKVSFIAQEASRQERVTRFPSCPEEIEEFVDEALRRSANRHAWFSYSHPDAEHSHAGLQATVDRASRYGALHWYNTDRKGGIHDWLWLSDNIDPSGDEPALISDDHTGAIYDPSSVLPLPQIAAVIHRFCLDGTGERPDGINWVTGEFNGYRHDTGKGGLIED